jgi:hypothetical protein
MFARELLVTPRELSQEDEIINSSPLFLHPTGLRPLRVLHLPAKTRDAKLRNEGVGYVPCSSASLNSQQSFSSAFRKTISEVQLCVRNNIKTIQLSNMDKS